MSGSSEITAQSADVNTDEPRSFGPVKAQFSTPLADRRPMRLIWATEHVACTQIVATPCARFVLQEIVRHCDEEGKSWPSVTFLARTIPRSGKRPHYSPVTVRVVLRKLRDMGLLLWDRVMPFGRFPPTRKGELGRFTPRGGRTWRPNLGALRAFARAAGAAVVRGDKKREGLPQKIAAAVSNKAKELRAAAATALVTVAETPVCPAPLPHWKGLRGEAALCAALGVDAQAKPPGPDERECPPIEQAAYAHALVDALTGKATPKEPPGGG